MCNPLSTIYGLIIFIYLFFFVLSNGWNAVLEDPSEEEKRCLREKRIKIAKIFDFLRVARSGMTISY